MKIPSIIATFIALFFSCFVATAQETILVDSVSTHETGLTFSHGSLADGATAEYVWSKDLLSGEWHASGHTDSDGTSVTIGHSEASGGIDVTADVSGTATDVLFVMVNVTGGDSGDSGDSGDTGVVFSGPFGDSVVDGNTYTVPTGAQPWAGFANEDTSLYPFSFPNGGTITFTGESSAAAELYFKFENAPYPNVDPNFSTATVTVNGAASEYSVEIPACKMQHKHSVHSCSMSLH